MNLKELIKLLREQANEIAKEGHNGWGNTMLQAADRLARGEELEKENKELKEECDQCQSDYEKEIADLQQENKELKLINEDQEKEIDGLGDNIYAFEDKVNKLVASLRQQIKEEEESRPSSAGSQRE